MEFLHSAWEFLASPAGAAIGFGLWVISEALASIPALKANSVFQMVHSLLMRFKKEDAAKVLLVVCLAAGLSACSALPTLSKVAPMICAYATSAEAKAAALALIEQMPDGENKQKAMLAIPVAELSADAACTMVKTMEAKNATQVP